MASILKATGLGLLATVFGLAGIEPASAHNPVVGGSHTVRHGYDPFNDHWYIDSHRVRVRESALAPTRGHIDPGSYRYVDRVVSDGFGGWVREYGPTWTSFGRPHGRLTRERITHYPGRPFHPGGTVGHRDTVIYSHPGAPALGGGGASVRERDTVHYMRAPGR